MKTLLELLEKKPDLYAQSPQNMWDDEHISKGMLEAHLNENLESATRRMEDVRNSVNWIVRKLPPSHYPALLDLGCGPGIYAELFNKAGYHVTGMDISARSINYAKASAQSKQMNISYMKADYTKVALSCKYDVITLIYCDFGIMPTNTRNELLRKMYQSLQPQGVFLFDVFTNRKYQGIDEHKDWEFKEGGFWAEQSYLDLHGFYRYEKDCTFLDQHMILMEDNIAYYNIWEHTFTLDELKKDLALAGFHQVTFYGNVAGEPCTKDDLTICVMACK